VVIPTFDTRALQAYLGHKNIQHTVRYTELVANVPPVRQCVPTGVAQHVWMHTELKLGPLDPVGPPFWRSPLG
jgi:hypothetical protein